MKNRSGFWRLLYRLPWLLLHIFIGLPLVLLCYTPPVRAVRVGGRAMNDVMLLWWSAMVCRIFGLKREIMGVLQPGAQLVVANHISWLDIKLLHSVSPMGFVAKAEIQRWPLAGWLASVGDSVFHHRGSHDSAHDVIASMTGRLRQGRKVAVFAEGGILPGFGVKHFHARLFAAAIDTGVPVQPVMLRYLREGRHYEDMTFLPGEGFAGNFFRLLMQAPCTAQVLVLPAIEPAGMQRRELAMASESAVKHAFEQEA